MNVRSPPTPQRVPMFPGLCPVDLIVSVFVQSRVVLDFNKTGMCAECV